MVDSDLPDVDLPDVDLPDVDLPDVDSLMSTCRNEMRGDVVSYCAMQRQSVILGGSGKPRRLGKDRRFAKPWKYAHQPRQVPSSLGNADAGGAS
jgi:hypothetical protein